MQDTVLKVAFLGDTNVGKTSIIHKIREEELKEVVTTTTAEIQTVTRVVCGRQVNMQIFDTAGQEKYRSIATSYFKNMDVFVIVYEIDERETFNNVEEWCRSLYDKVGDETRIFLVANKIDLFDESRGSEFVSSTEGNVKANKINAMFFETSATQNRCLTELFDAIAECHPKCRNNVFIIDINREENSESKCCK